MSAKFIPFAAVAACFVGSALGCLIFLYGVIEPIPTAKHKPPATGEPHTVSQADTQAGLKAKWDEAKHERAKLLDVIEGWKGLVGEVHTEMTHWRDRARLAEQRLANCEQQLATARTLADAARRANTRVPGSPTGDEPGDRIPPQMVPVP